MLSHENFLSTLEQLLAFRKEHLPEAKLHKKIPEIDMHGKLDETLWQKLKEIGIEDIFGTIELLGNMLHMMSAFIGEDIADSHYVERRYQHQKFKDQVKSLKLEDFIFLDAVGHHNLSGIVKRFRVRKRKDNLVTGLNLIFFDIETRRVLFRPGMGCTVTFKKRDRRKLRSQPDMSRFLPTYRECKKGDLIIGGNETAGPDLNGLDDAIKGVFENIEGTQRGTKAVLVVHKDKIIREVYNNEETAAIYNPPAIRDDVHANTPLLGWSMTKSVTNAMLGAMIQKGMFGDYEAFYSATKRKDVTDGEVMKQFLINLKIRDYIPELSDPRKRGWRDINMNDLLHMASGLVWAEDDLPYDVFQMIYRERDMVRYAATKGVQDPPSDKWYYSSGTANIVSGVMQACFRQQRHDLEEYWSFPHENLFEPTGMCNATFQADIEGTLVGSSYCIATARDWARFGLLFLHDGVIQKTNERILPKGWVAYTATKGESDTGQDISGGIYGGHFWLNQAKKKDLNDDNRNTGYLGVPDDMFYPRGLFGQRVFIIPSMDLVVVRMGARDKIGLKKFINGVVTAFKS